MSGHATTLEEELAMNGVTSGYFIWKPNRLFAKSGNSYISTDVVADGTAEDVIAAVTAAGEEQIEDINELGTTEINELETLRTQYAAIKSNVIKAYNRMKRLFIQRGDAEMEAIIDNAIYQLNQL